MSKLYIHNKHSVTGGGFHYSFTPKYRQPAFEDDEIKFYMNNVFKAAANRLGVEIRCIEFGPDHVHVFITKVKNHSQAKIAGYLKGLTSRLVRRDLWDRVKKYEWGSSFWSDGYFSDSVGHFTDAHIEHYITSQQKKHWVRPRLKTQKKVAITQTTLQDYP